MCAVHDSNAAKYERLYFAPGEVILHLECDLNYQSIDVKNFIDNLIGPNAAPPWSELQWITEFQGLELESILFYPRLNDGVQQMVLVPLEMKNLESPQDEYIDLLQQIYNLSVNPEERIVTPHITIRDASPNWFMTAVHHQGSTGGPGGPPDDAGPQTGVPVFNYSREVLDALEGGDAPQEVHVAVLDSAPSVADFVLAEKSDWFDKHPLKSWLDNQRRTIEYAQDDPIRAASFKRLVAFTILDQHYEMPDHGLFVSGIIHTFAKDAILYLYEVLNRSGIGTYYTVAQALSKILESLGDKNLIINCSLVLDIPRAGHYHENFPFDRTNDFFHFTTEAVKVLFERIVQLEQVIVVAAAGNDRRSGRAISDIQPIHLQPSPLQPIVLPPSPLQPTVLPPSPSQPPVLPPTPLQPNVLQPSLFFSGRPDARYPAAYHGIIGVGAISMNGQQRNPASYSNLSDDPSNTGYLVFGGEAGAGNGVLGVYICSFPDHPQPAIPGNAVNSSNTPQYTSNNSGWAWWCGTSFATPVVSGLLAQYWGSHSSMDAIDFLNRASSSTITGTNERVINVT